MSRGMRSYGRRRDLLHKNQLEAFKTWIQQEGWSIVPSPPGAVYEVLRIRKDRALHIFFQRDADQAVKDGRRLYDKHNPGSTHITVPMGAVSLVKKFIIMRDMP